MTSISSMTSSVFSCAIALQGASAATTNMLVVSANHAVGGFLLIVAAPPPKSVEPVDYIGNFRAKAIEMFHMQVKSLSPSGLQASAQP